jgi:hypothetical protein
METPVSTPAKIITPSAPKRCKRKFEERRGLEVEDLVEKMERRPRLCLRRKRRGTSEKGFF